MSKRIVQVFLVVLLLLFNISDLVGTEKAKRLEKWLIWKCRMLRAKILPMIKRHFVNRPKSLLKLLPEIVTEPDEAGDASILHMFIALVILFLLAGIIGVINVIISGEWDELWTMLRTNILAVLLFLLFVVCMYSLVIVPYAMYLVILFMGFAAGLLLATLVVLLNTFGEFTGQPSIFKIGKYIVTSGLLIWSLIK